MKQRIKAVLALALLLAFATGALAEAPGTDPVITGEAIEPMVGEKDAVELVEQAADDAFDGCDTDMVIRGIAGSTAWQFAQAKGFPFEREDEGIAVLNLPIDPDEFLSVVDSLDHSYRAAGGTIRLLPSEGAETTLPLEYIRGRGNSTWRVDEKKPLKFLNW